MINTLTGTPESFVSEAASKPPEAKVSLDRTLSYQGRSLKIMSPRDFPQIKEIFQGSASSVKEVFFPRAFNFETRLMQEAIVDLIHDTQAVQFEFGAKATDVKMKYKGKIYNFYDVMKKIKWDLISLDDSTLDKHLLNFNECRYNSSYYPNPQAPIYKKYLYAKLHKAEKAAVADYGSIGTIYNCFLRAKVDKYSATQNYFVMYLCKTAVLCSGLNKIPPSKEFDAADAYAYRCMSDATNSEGDSIIEICTEKMRAHQKIKELGFTGVAYRKPQKGFLGGGYNKSCLKVYLNPRMLAKDISGLSSFPNECECLFLPNTKELIMREVHYVPKTHYCSDESGSRHIFLTKLISKRQAVI